MKLNSPFLWLLLLAYLFSCNNNGNKEKSSSEKMIENWLNELATDTSHTHKSRYAEKAIRLAEKDKNISLQYTSVQYKLDHLIAEKHPDSILFYLDKLQFLGSRTEKPALKTAYIFYRKAEYWYAQKKYNKAFEFHAASKKIFEKENDSLWAGYSLLKMAHIQQIFNDYAGSEETLTEALVFLEKRNDAEQYLREANNLLGISYTGLKDYNQAVRYYKVAKGMTSDELSKKIIDNNIALCYQEENQHAKAIDLLNVLHNTTVIQNDSSSLAKVKGNLGYSKFMADGSGKELLEEALQIRNKLGDLKGMVYSYLHLSEYYTDKNPVLTFDYAQKAYQTATKVGAIDSRIKALRKLALLKEGYNSDYFLLRDSVDDFRQKAKNQFAKMRFDAKRDREEIMANKAKQIEAELRNLIVGSILFTVILVIIALYVISLIRHKKEKRIQKQQEQYNAEIRISKKLHDELANDIFNTMIFAEVRNLSEPENKEILLDNLDKIYAQTRNISQENSNISTNEKYLSQLKEMLSGYMSDEVNIIIKAIEAIDWQALQPVQKIVVYRVLQELLVNMKKHSKATLVVLDFKKTDKKIQISYSDNGVGISDEKSFMKNGLQNVENRISSINGTITFEPIPHKGFKVIFSFNY